MTKQLITMGLITTLLNLLGCSQKTKNESEAYELSPKTEVNISKSLEAFENRPIFKDLTEEIIDKTSDNDLLQVVFDNLSERLPEDHSQEYKTVMGWNRSRQSIYIIWLLEAEVNNGGFNQFYFNSSGQFYKHLPEALKLVGANKYAVLTQSANDVYERENVSITKHQDCTIEGFSKSYEDNPLNKFDEDFYQLYKTENLLQQQVDFIRKNKKEFVDK